MKQKYSFIILISIILSACSTQNWYSAAQSANTAHCLNQPLSEYDDCQQHSYDSYNEYEKKREKLLLEENSN